MRNDSGQQAGSSWQKTAETENSGQRHLPFWLNANVCGLP